MIIANLLDFLHVCRLRKTCTKWRKVISPSFLYSHFQEFIFDPLSTSPETDDDILKLLKIRDALFLGKIGMPNYNPDDCSELIILMATKDFIIFTNSDQEYFQKRKSTKKLIPLNDEFICSNGDYSPTNFRYCIYKTLVVDEDGNYVGTTPIPKNASIGFRKTQNILYYDIEKNRMIHQSIEKSKETLIWEDVHYPSLDNRKPKSYNTFSFDGLVYHSSEFIIHLAPKVNSVVLDRFGIEGFTQAKTINISRNTLDLEFHFPNDPKSKTIPILCDDKNIRIIKSGKKRFLIGICSDSINVYQFCGSYGQDMILEFVISIEISNSWMLCDRCGIVVFSSPNKIIAIDLSTFKVKEWKFPFTIGLNHVVQEDKIVVREFGEFKYALSFLIS